MMLALALGFLGAVVVVGAFCGGVFLGCWLCGEDGTPSRAVSGPSHHGGDRKTAPPKGWRERRVFWDGYDAGYADGNADGNAVRNADRNAVRNADRNADRHEVRFAAGRGTDRRETMEKPEDWVRGDSEAVRTGEQAGMTGWTGAAEDAEAVRTGEQAGMTGWTGAAEDAEAVRTGEQAGMTGWTGAAEDAEVVRTEEKAREAARQRRRLLDEQAAFRALQRYSAEHAYGLGSTGFSRRSAMD